MKQYYDQSCQSAPEYKVGDKVWLSLQNYSSDHPMKKLNHKWAGPFAIMKVISPATIKLHSQHRRRTSTPSYLSPLSTPTSLMRLQNAHNLCNLVLSWLMTKRNTKSRKSWTPGSGGVNYGTWLSSSGGHTWITCGSCRGPCPS